MTVPQADQPPRRPNRPDTVAPSGSRLEAIAHRNTRREDLACRAIVPPHLP